MPMKHLHLKFSICVHRLFFITNTCLISRYETKVEALKRNKMSTIRHEIEQHLLCVHALSEEVSTFFSKSIQFQIPPYRQETRWQQ